jgi:hypothetical protein
MGTIGALLSVGGMSGSDSDHALHDFVPDILRIHDEADELFITVYICFILCTCSYNARPGDAT